MRGYMRCTQAHPAPRWVMHPSPSGSTGHPYITELASSPLPPQPLLEVGWENFLCPFPFPHSLVANLEVSLSLFSSPACGVPASHG